LATYRKRGEHLRLLESLFDEATSFIVDNEASWSG
jgi:hypothetical protein